MSVCEPVAEMPQHMQAPARSFEYQMVKAQTLLTGEDLNRTCMRLAHQFVEPFDTLDDIAVIGMQTRGVDIARKIH
ncbi:hypothetical protein QLX67_13255, partial [Balneolaceae bacterium ANBcel3]|nr:hypothetical protein [Balneolaceae bacterium ANBcel3]